MIKLSGTPAEVAAGLPPLALDCLRRCCERGSTRANDGGMVDDFLSMMCSNTGAGIDNGWLVAWEMNPGYRTDGYVNRYVPTELGRQVAAAAAEGRKP